MKNHIRLCFSALAVLLALVIPLAGFAQETTSSIRGRVLDNDSNAVAEAAVVVEDLRTNSTRRFSTNDSGTFLATNLPVGGPYRVTVNDVKSVVIENIELGDIYNLTINLREGATLEEVVVIGQSAELINVAAGPAATFSRNDIETAVSINRDIVDVYGLDPRLNIDNEDDGFAINCGGQHPRFNSVTLDGVSYNDRFGLNDNGYSTATGMPFPFDGINQIAVELAPFDVTYGGFSACNINSVTRSGGNEWFGNAFYDYTSDKFRGDSLGRLDDRDLSSPPYTQDRKGFSLGGPIIKDRLFFFVAYEDSTRPRFLARGYSGSGVGEERDWLSKEEYERVDRIARDLYGYDTGGMPSDGAAEDEKYMLRLDWNVSDRHSASFIYNYYDGFQDRDSDGDPDEFEFANHFYVKGAESETFTLMFKSQWTDNFSTDVFYSQNEMNDSQVTVGPKDFGDFQIETFGGETIYLGADDSRQANSLNTESEYFKLSAQYLLGNNVITAGYEREKVDIFNIFVQHSRGGEWDFYTDERDGPDAADCPSLTASERFQRMDCDVSGVDLFELGRPSRIYYGSGGGTNVANDAAAIFSNTLNTAYLQDEIFFDAMNLTVVAGLRYDWFTSSDQPNYNQKFYDVLGIRNDAGIDGVDILMPRIGFTWEASPTVTVRGGVGLFSGGNPNVWISNAWSNDGLTNAQVSLRFRNNEGELFGPDAIPLTGPNPGYDIPQELFDEVAGVTPEDGVTSRMALIDPKYKQPSQWKLAIGAHWETPWWGIEADVDYMYSKSQDPAYYVDVSQSVQAFTALGTPVYDYTFDDTEDNYMLTNSRYSPRTHLVSVLLNKDFDNGLDLTLGYAYTDAEDVASMASATAGSNFDNTTLVDINNPKPATSNYVVPNRFTFRARYAKAFFGDYLTRFTLYGSSAEGQPQSYVMFSGPLEGDGFFGRHQLYVPDGEDDQFVEFAPGFDQEAFFAFIEQKGLKPGLQQRNNTHAKWTTRFDLRIDQEFPIWGRLRGRAFMNIYNLGNLINDNWGEVWDGQFFAQQVIYGDINSQGQFVYERFRERDINYFRQQRSLWEIRLGVEVNF